MESWSRTPDGWALNLDGTDAAREFTLPRIELHAGPRGWTAVCRLADGGSRTVALGAATTVAAAKRAAVAEALLAFGPSFEPALRALL